MVIHEKHIKNKRRVGTLNKSPVMEIETTGGLHIIAANRNGKPTVLGSGPHRAVARFLAEKADKDLQLFELSKSEQVDVEALRSVAPKYEAITAAMNGLLDKLQE